MWKPQSVKRHEKYEALLEAGGEMSSDELEIMVDVSPQMLERALGWLARDDQVEILSECMEPRFD